MKPALESELDWIDNHPEYYRGKQYQEQVKKISIRDTN